MTSIDVSFDDILHAAILLKDDGLLLVNLGSLDALLLKLGPLDALFMLNPRVMSIELIFSTVSILSYVLVGAASLLEFFER